MWVRSPPRASGRSTEGFVAIGHPVFWLFVAAVAAPLLAKVRWGVRVPIVVLEVLLGIVIGPHLLDLVGFEGFVVPMFAVAMAVTLFMAGMELDFGAIAGRPLRLAFGGWCFSLLLGFSAVGLLHAVPAVSAPYMVAPSPCVPPGSARAAPGVPRQRSNRSAVRAPAGRRGDRRRGGADCGHVAAALARRYTTWQEFGFLLAFILMVGSAVGISRKARPPRLLAYLGEQMHTGTQLPVRLSLLLMAGLIVIAEQLGFETIFGAFAAGLSAGRSASWRCRRCACGGLDAVSFGWFYPFFFVGTGVKFDVTALGRNLNTMLMVPTFVLLLLLIRGAPVLLYRHDLRKAHSIGIHVALARCGAGDSSIRTR